MSDLTVILEQLEQQAKQLGKIEEILIENAVQNTKIVNIQEQLNLLWVKYDTNFGPDGTISRLKNHQARCPRPQLSRLWWSHSQHGTLHHLDNYHVEPQCPWVFLSTNPKT